MSEAKKCPHCGGLLDQETDTHSNQAETTALANPEGHPDATSIVVPAETENESFNDSVESDIVAGEPDPILGQTEYGAADPPTALLTSDPTEPPGSDSTSRSSLFLHLNIEPVENFSTARIPSRNGSEPAKTAKASMGEAEEEPEERRTVWTGVLLASYASAVTLALVWFVMKERGRENAEPIPVTKKAAKVESPLTAERSKKFQPPEPILGEHFAKLGQSIQVGSLEITPIDVKRQDVKLEKTSVLSVPETSDGGKKALVLRLKLKNLSVDEVFSPLDPLYLRARGDELVDTFVTTASNERIYPFKLALESDLSIVGQDFSELRPLESRIVSIVTAPDAPPDSTGPFTWRVRLRTGVGRTDVIGLVWPTPSESKTGSVPR